MTAREVAAEGLYKQWCAENGVLPDWPKAKEWHPFWLTRAGAMIAALRSAGYTVAVLVEDYDLGWDDKGNPVRVGAPRYRIKEQS